MKECRERNHIINLQNNKLLVSYSYNNAILKLLVSYRKSVQSTPMADHNGRAVYGMNCLRSLERRDRGFESHSRYGYLFVFILCLC
jgi:hypothetical protein